MSDAQKIKELEERVRQLELRPIYVPYPVYPPYWQQPIWYQQPICPNISPPTITCTTGGISALPLQFQNKGVQS